MVVEMERKRVKVPRRRAVLAFEGEYDGIEVTCLLDVPLRTFFEFQRMAEDIETSFQEFGDRVLIEWNLEGDDGESLPATGDGFKELPPQFANLILTKWLEAVAQPAPLPSSELPSTDT